MLRLAIGSLLGIVFLAAALGKASEPVRFGVVLANILPQSARDPALLRFLIVLVVVFEAALGMWLILSGGSRRSAAWALAALGVFTLALGAIYAKDESRSCGCFGPMFDAGLRVAVGRNIVLMVMSVWLLGGSDRGAATVRRRSGGFTLLELLVVIAVTAVLISLVAPHLRGVRDETRAVVKLSDLRQIVGVTSMYAGDNGEYLPFVGPVGDPTAPFIVKGVRVPTTFFKAHALLWANLIWPDYIEQRAMLERRELNDREPDRPTDGGSSLWLRLPEKILVTEILLTHTAAADPVYWHDEDGKPVDLDFGHIRGQRIDAVRHPGRKGLLFVAEELSFIDRQGAVRYAGADGSAHRRPFEAFVHPEFIVARPFGAMDINVMSTRDGFEGVDY